MKVDKTIMLIREECGRDNDKVIKFVFDKIEEERSLFWIQVARTITNQLRFEAEVFSKL